MLSAYVRAERIILKTHPELNEKWVQGLISQDTRMLGLGDLVLYESPEISGHECAFDVRPPSSATYRGGRAEAQLTAQSERIRSWLVANRFQAISQASMMSVRLIRLGQGDVNRHSEFLKTLIRSAFELRNS